MGDSVYQFRIELEESDPLIWRQIMVPESYTFWDLHVAIQDAMGWEDYHLHSFRVWSKEESRSIIIGIPDADFSEAEYQTVAGWKVGIKNHFPVEGSEVEYTYDFGDYWVHTVTLEKITPAVTGLKYPVCSDGENACPPEDCGGVPGYEELLHILQDPDDDEYEEMLAWVGKVINPTEFNIDDVVFDNPAERLKKMKE